MKKKTERLNKHALQPLDASDPAVRTGSGESGDSQALADGSSFASGAQTAQVEIPQYGMPRDAREWRQFLVLRPCPSKNPANRRTHILPCVLWVKPRPLPCRCCGDPVTYTVLPASASTVEIASGVPLSLPDEKYYICSSEGEFIE